MKTIKKKLVGEIEIDISKWKDILCSWTGKLNIVRTQMLSKVIYGLNAIPSKVPMIVFCRDICKKKKILKFTWHLKGP